MILEHCNLNHGDKANLYEKIGEVLKKIQEEIKGISDRRAKEINKVDTITWSNIEIAQLLVAVFNLGEGEWQEV